jgi:hypothetical protein
MLAFQQASRILHANCHLMLADWHRLHERAAKAHRKRHLPATLEWDQCATLQPMLFFPFRDGRRAVIRPLANATLKRKIGF